MPNDPKKNDCCKDDPKMFHINSSMKIWERFTFNCPKCGSRVWKNYESFRKCARCEFSWKKCEDKDYIIEKEV